MQKKIESLLSDITPSDQLETAIQDYKSKLQVLIEVNSEYARLQEEFYITLFENKALNKDSILNRPDELNEIAQVYENALKEADLSSEKLAEVKLMEARLGKLTSSKDPDGSKLKEALKKLLGDFDINLPANSFNPESIEGRLIVLTKEQNASESEIYKIQ